MFIHLRTLLSLVRPLGKRVSLVPKKHFSVSKSDTSSLKTLRYEQKRGYKNFSHKREVEPIATKVFCLFCIVVIAGTLVDWRWCRMLFLYYSGQLEEKNKEKQKTKNGNEAS